jgi:hypothetical protein
MCTHIGLGTRRRMIASQEKTQWLEMVTEQIEQTQRNKRTFKIKQAPAAQAASLPVTQPPQHPLRRSGPVRPGANDRPGPVPFKVVFAPVGATFMCLCFQKRLLQAHSSF